MSGLTPYHLYIGRTTAEPIEKKMQKNLQQVDKRISELRKSEWTNFETVYEIRSFQF